MRKANSMDDWQEHRYDDIIDLPHHQSATHPQMSRHDRAAQFAPFAALTGHAAVLKETARLTEERIELDEEEKQNLSMQLQILNAQPEDRRAASFTYFVPDERKSGGFYATTEGIIKKIDEYEQVIVLRDGTRIPIAQVIEIAKCTE